MPPLIFRIMYLGRIFKHIVNIVMLLKVLDITHSKFLKTYLLKLKRHCKMKCYISQYEQNRTHLEIGDAEISVRILHSTSSIGPFLKIQVMLNMMYHKCFSIEFDRCQITFQIIITEHTQILTITNMNMALNF